MSTVSIRELRNHGGDVMTRVARGESLTVTSNGRPVGRLVPLPTATPTPADLVARWRKLPPMSLSALRADIDDVMDARL